MKSALLVIGGDLPSFEIIRPRLAEFDIVAAADSGLDAVAAWGLEPSLVVGDMDSIRDRSLLTRFPGAQTIVAQEDKDETDTEIGMRLLGERGYSRITLAGGGGGRMDHFLAIRCLFEKAFRPVEWLTDSARFICAETMISLDVERGSIVSVFPLCGGARGMHSEGLRWPLDGLEWGPGDFGISNVACADRITIDPGDHPLLLFLPGA